MGKGPDNSQTVQLKRAKTRQATKEQSATGKQNDGKVSIKSSGDIVHGAMVAVGTSPDPGGTTTATVDNKLMSELVKLMTVIQQQQQKITNLEQQLCTILSVLGDIVNKQQDQFNLQSNHATALDTSVLPLLKDIAAKQRDQLGPQQSQERTTDVPAAVPAALRRPRPATRLFTDVVIGRGGRSGRTCGRADDDNDSRVTSDPVVDVGGGGDGDEFGRDSQFTLVVHRTLNDMSRRSKNIIISGLPEESDTGTSDRTTVNEFTAAFLQIKPALSAGRCCRRIGKPSADRPRRLLVHLDSEQAAAELRKTCSSVPTCRRQPPSLRTRHARGAAIDVEVTRQWTRNAATTSSQFLSLAVAGTALRTVGRWRLMSRTRSVCRRWARSPRRPLQLRTQNLLLPRLLVLVLSLFCRLPFARQQSIVNFVMLNARSINNKLPDLYNLLYSRAYDVIIIGESWLRNSTPDGLIDPNNQYTCIRCDRQSVSSGGGVCVFVSKVYTVAVIDLADIYPELEICCFDLTLESCRCRVLAVYRSPSCDSSHMSRLLECLCKFSDVGYHCIIAGDLNCPGVDWVSLKAPADNIQNALLDFAVTRGFSQIVDSPTRLDNILDIVLTSEPLAICNTNVIEPFSTSDHCQVEFSVFNDCAATAECRDEIVKRYDWSSADYDAMSNYIASVDWLSLLSTNLTADNLWSAFSNVLQSAIDLFVPVNYVRRDNSVKCRRWYPAALKRAIARKRCLWRKHRESPDDERLLAAYHGAERKCRQMLRDYEIKRENRVIDSDNAGSFFPFRQWQIIV